MIITKIQFHDKNAISESIHYKLSKKQKIGTMIISFLVATSVTSGLINNMQDSHKEEIDALIPPFTTDLTIDEINDMNIILDDNDCSDTFFQDVADKLKEDGIVVKITADGEGINQNNSTIITLDQQYSAGEGTIIFAPYDNARVGHSDSLALSMQAAFKQNGFIADDILCGKAGYEIDEDGNVQYYFPTDTEKSINEGYDSSYVTISFGTQNQNAEWVAKSIENGLARQKYYLNGDDNQSDLIYRANDGDKVDDVANYFGTESNELKQFNSIDGSECMEAQTIINPAVQNIQAFNKNGMFQIDGSKTRSY